MPFEIRNVFWQQNAVFSLNKTLYLHILDTSTEHFLSLSYSTKQAQLSTDLLVTKQVTKQE